MSDFDKLIRAKEAIMKAKTDYEDEIKDFIMSQKTCRSSDLQRAQYLRGRADAMRTAYAIIENIINQE